MKARVFAKKICVGALCTTAGFGLLLAAVLFVSLRSPLGTVRVTHASGFTSFTFASSTSPATPVRVDLAARQWLIEAVPDVGASSGSGSGGCAVDIITSVPSTKYGGSFRITTDYGWKPVGSEPAHAVINLSADTLVSVSLAYSQCAGSVTPGTDSVSYLFFPIGANTGFLYAATPGIGPLTVDGQSQVTLPSAGLTLPAGTWLMEVTPNVIGAGGGSSSKGGAGGCQFTPNISGVTPTLTQRGSFRVFVYQTYAAMDEPGYVAFTTSAPTNVKVSASYTGCGTYGGDYHPTTQVTNSVLYKFFQVQPGGFQYVQDYGSVPLTAGGWTVETSLDVVGAGSNGEGCNFNTYLGGASVSGSCSNPSSTCQTSQSVCTSQGSCEINGWPDPNCTDQYTCQEPGYYFGGCGGTWVQGCQGTWNPTPSNAWSQKGGFAVYTYNTQAAGQKSDFLGINLSSPATVRPSAQTFNCSTQPPTTYYKTNHSMYLFFSNSPAPVSTGNVTVTSEDSVVTSTLVNADWSQGAFVGSVADPCAVGSCAGTERTYPNMPLGIYTLSAGAVTTPSSTYVLHSIESAPIALQRPTVPLLSLPFISEFFNTANAATDCGFMNGAPDTCTPLDQFSLTLATAGQQANFIILWDPVAAVSVSPSTLPLSAVSPNSASGQVTLTNSGGQGSTLNWTATSSAPWLTVWPASGCLNAGGKTVNGCSDTNGYKYLTLTANASSLASGTYTGTVTFTGTSTPATSRQLAKQTITVTFTIGAAPPPPPSPSCTFGANPQQIVPPGQSTLSWTCTNTVSCQLDGVSVPTKGSEQVSPATNTTYTLSCQGSGSGPTNTVTTQTTVTTGGPSVHEINP